MAPPPVRIIPLSIMSDDNSGGVSSSTARTAPMIASSGSVMASVTSLAWIWIVRGRPATSSRPRTSMRISSYRHSAADGDLDLFRRPLADTQVVLALDVVGDRLVEAVAPDSQGASDDDPVE